MTSKKKKALLKLPKEITRVDEKTFYCPSQSEPNREPYFVYKSDNIGWTCDCMSFTMNIKDSAVASTPDCKHIILIKKEYNLT